VTSTSRTRNSRAVLPAGIVFQATVYNGSSCAEESWTEALGLAENQIPVHLVPVGPQDDCKRLLPDSARRALEELKGRRLDVARSVLYYGVMPAHWNLDLYGHRRVGRTMFGTDRIPDGWCERCNAMDEVWVPSEFNRETFVAAGVDPRKLRVLHAGVDTEVFRPGLLPLGLAHRRKFNFLSVSNLDPRKGTDLLLKAYLKEFKPDEDVTLILKISADYDERIDPAAQLAFFVEREVGFTLEQSPPLILLNGPMSQAAMASLYTAASAFVLPTHGEGYGRAFLEALACELPVIATRWSGQLDFLNDQNSYLIDVEGLVPASTECEFFAGHLWAQPSVDHLRQLMREVYSHPEEARQRATRGRHHMLQHWDWSVAVPRWIDEFRRLLE
jgi:glycosyltransferase involved in cell wall biosynthesis